MTVWEIIIVVYFGVAVLVYLGGFIGTVTNPPTLRLKGKKFDRGLLLLSVCWLPFLILSILMAEAEFGD